MCGIIMLGQLRRSITLGGIADLLGIMWNYRMISRSVRGLYWRNTDLHLSEKISEVSQRQDRAARGDCD